MIPQLKLGVAFLVGTAFALAATATVHGPTDYNECLLDAGLRDLPGTYPQWGLAGRSVDGMVALMPRRC